jgi:hypothetical protein
MTTHKSLEPLGRIIARVRQAALAQAEEAAR